MSDDTDAEKRDTAARFGRAATDYRDSDTHRRGEDLETLAAWCAGADRALDVATGAGHTAGALNRAGVASVVAVDAAPAMVEAAVDAYGVEACVADAERLPFAAAAFDAVTCRIAAHHFPAPESFVEEAARVLTPGGTLAFEDNVAPANPREARFVDGVERLRDPSHVGLDTPAEWRRRFVGAGFTVEEETTVTRRLDFQAWCDRTAVSERDRRELRRRFAEADAALHERFAVVSGPGGIESFVVPKRLFRLRKRGSTTGTDPGRADER